MKIRIITEMDYNQLNKTRIHESILTEINGEGKLFITVEWQLIKIARLTEIENHHFTILKKRWVQEGVSMDAKAMREWPSKCTG